MRKFLRKRVLVPIGFIATLAIAGVAAGYLSSAGSGSGTGSVTDSTSALVLHSSALSFDNIGQLKTVTVTADNTGTSAERIAAVTVTPSSTDSTTCPTGSFTAGSFSFDSAFVTANKEVPAKTNGVTVGTIGVTFNDLTGSAQNGCIGTGTASLALSSN
jgi:hypothetical protein